jgi:hypothetical protein
VLTQIAQLGSSSLSVQRILFWVCFTSIGMVNILMLPPRETFDLFFFVGIVLDSLKKKSAQIPDPNPEKDHFVFG